MAQYKKYSDLQESVPKHIESVDSSRSSDTTVVHITGKGHRENIIAQNKVVLLDMFAPWCGPCTAVAPKVDMLAQKYGKQGVCAVIKEDVDNKFPSTQGTPPVRGVPTFFFFKNGAFVDSVVGGGIEQIESKLNELLFEYMKPSQQGDTTTQQHIEAGGGPPRRQLGIRR